MLADPALDVLAQLLKSPRRAVAVRAANTILDRAGLEDIGEGQGYEPAKPRRMTDEQWQDFERLLEEARRKKSIDPSVRSYPEDE